MIVHPIRIVYVTLVWLALALVSAQAIEEAEVLAAQQQ